MSGENGTGPDRAHRRPPGVDDLTVQALGKLSEALETVERARGHLYALHQLTGTADFQLDEAVSLFMQAGHTRRVSRKPAGAPSTGHHAGSDQSEPLCLFHRLWAAALGVVGEDHGGDERGDHHGEEPRRVVDESGCQRRLEGGQQEAEPGEAALALGEETGRSHRASLPR
jgi:hypothetical protein